MADVVVGGGCAGISWVDDKSSEDQPLVLVSGLSTEENLHMVVKKVSRCSGETGEMGYGGKGRVKATARPEGGARKKLAACSTLHSKASLFNMSPCPPAITTTTVGSPANHMAFFTVEQPVPERAHVKSHASLKDLCPEDKRRIANLIQELARVNEEKDETSQRLQDEQESFERKIQQLEEQNQLIVQERENLKQQYRECQELLGLYQQYLKQQQEKLNESIAQLQHSGSKQVTNSEDGCARPWVQDLDGSYLGLNPYGGACSSFPSKQSWTAAPSHLSSCSKQGTGQSEGQIQKNGCSEEGAKFQSGLSVKGCFVNRVPGCLGALEPCNSHHSHYVENCKDDTATRLQGGYSSLLAEDDKRHSVHEESDKGQVAAPAPSLPLEDWKEKKRQLMLQKMELEAERARLQTVVMQRKDHLLRQNQQLHHSHFKQISRFQGVEMAELEHSGLKLQKQEARETEQNTLSSQSNVSALPGDLEDVTGSAVQRSTEKLQSNDASASCASNKSAFLRDGIPFSSQEAGTSLGSQTKHRPEVVQVMLPHKSRTSPAHLDSSVADLLEVLSPASGWNQRTCFTLQHPMQQFHSVHEVHRDPLQAQFIPRVSFQPPSCTIQDPEESQILEEIFFIC